VPSILRDSVNYNVESSDQVYADMLFLLSTSKVGEIYIFRLTFGSRSHGEGSSPHSRADLGLRLTYQQPH
jgi:hypothetical protein